MSVQEHQKINSAVQPTTVKSEYANQCGKAIDSAGGPVLAIILGHETLLGVGEARAQ